LKAISGALKLSAGDIKLSGVSLAGLSVERRIRMGIGYLRQSDNIFPGQTVEENFDLAGLMLPRAVYLSARDEMLELFPFLKAKLKDRSGSLSGGQRQALALAMVFLSPRKLYLLDEPTAGLSPVAAQDIMDRVRQFVKDDVTRSVLMVEHRLDLLSWVDRAVFLSQGKVKSETHDITLLQNADWLAKNYF
jgi:ABC-type branched-subunit amino acid transport system ATPase component